MEDGAFPLIIFKGEGPPPPGPSQVPRGRNAPVFWETLQMPQETFFRILPIDPFTTAPGLTTRGKEEKVLSRIAPVGLDVASRRRKGLELTVVFQEGRLFDGQIDGFPASREKEEDAKRDEGL